VRSGQLQGKHWQCGVLLAVPCQHAAAAAEVEEEEVDEENECEAEAAAVEEEKGEGKEVACPPPPSPEMKPTPPLPHCSYTFQKSAWSSSTDSTAQSARQSSLALVRTVLTVSESDSVFPKEERWRDHRLLA
jgi:hypothetical protein